MDFSTEDVAAVSRGREPHARLPPFALAGRSVLMLDDFTRCPANGMTHHVLNRQWLHALLAVVLDEAGCRVREWTGDGRHDDVRAFMTLLGLAASPAGWAATAAVDPLPPGAERWLADRIGDVDLVIGFELPLFLLRFLGRRGIAFLDIGIDPVRFARDLFLAVRTNDAALERRLALYEIDETLPRTDAALLRATAIRTAGRTIGDPAARVAVFFGQTCIDRALVSRGRLAHPAAFAPAIAEAARDVDLLLIRPHPLEPDTTLMRDLQARIPAARQTSADSYALLACDNVQRVLSLSSGLLIEARYFGKPATRFLVPDDDRSGCCSRRYRLDTGLLSAGFWHGERPSLPTTPDLLRNSLGITWGRVRTLRLEPPDTSLRARLAPRRLGRGLMARTKRGWAALRQP